MHKNFFSGKNILYTCCIPYLGEISLACCVCITYKLRDGMLFIKSDGIQKMQQACCSFFSALSDGKRMLVGYCCIVTL